MSIDRDKPIADYACSRCATHRDLRHLSKTRALREGFIVPPTYHTEGDCLRYLARAISELEKASPVFYWRVP